MSCSPPSAPWSCLCEAIVGFRNSLNDPSQRTCALLQSIVSFLVDNHDAIINQFASCAWAYDCDDGVTPQFPEAHLSRCLPMIVMNLLTAAKDTAECSSPDSYVYTMAAEYFGNLSSAIVPGCCEPVANRAGHPYFLTLARPPSMQVAIPMCVPMTIPVSRDVYQIFPTQDQCLVAIQTNPNPPPPPSTYLVPIDPSPSRSKSRPVRLGSRPVRLGSRPVRLAPVPCGFQCNLLGGDCEGTTCCYDNMSTDESTCTPVTCADVCYPPVSSIPSPGLCNSDGFQCVPSTQAACLAQGRGEDVPLWCAPTTS